MERAIYYLNRKVPNNYLFELKWVKQKDHYKKIKKEGIEQVEGYLKLNSPHL